MDIFCKSVLKDSLLYPLPIYNIWVLHWQMNEESLDSDCLPLPPTPISIAFPRGCTIIRLILKMCSIAYLKNVNSSFPLVSTLYSYILDSKNSEIFLISSICSYRISSVSKVMMVVKVIPNYFPFILSRSTPSPNLLLIETALLANHYLSELLVSLSQNILCISWYHNKFIFSTVLQVSTELCSIPWKTLLISLRLNW